MITIGIFILYYLSNYSHNKTLDFSRIIIPVTIGWFLLLALSSLVLIYTGMLVRKHFIIPLNHILYNFRNIEEIEITRELKISNIYYEETGDLIDLFNSFVDILLKNKMHESELLEAIKETNEAYQVKSTFLANMSHELRTPLNGIIGYTQLLKMNSILSDFQAESVNVIEHSSNHLLSMINDILDLSKIEAKKMDIMIDEIDFSLLMRNISAIHAIKAREKGLEFKSHISSDLPQFVLGDQKRLSQILDNLLGNAVKYTNVGGVVFSIRLLSENALDNYIKIRFLVEDTGTGIPQEQIDNIFTPFFQVNTSYQRRYTEGTGLGLAISQNLANLMGSKIEIKSTLGFGTQFWFDLIMTKAFTDYVGNEFEQSNNIKSYQGPLKTILIVDDIVETLDILKQALLPLGFKVVTCTSASLALDLIDETKPNIIICDIIMPIMNGFEFIRKVKTNPNWENIIIFAISAEIDKNNRDLSFEIGANEFIDKPFRITNIVQLITKWLKLEWKPDSCEIDKDLIHATDQTTSPEKSILLEMDKLLKLGDVSQLRNYIISNEELRKNNIQFYETTLQLLDDFRINDLKNLVKKNLPET